VIDLGVVNGSAFVVDVFGRLLRFVQNGDVQRYFGATVFGLVAILWWTDCETVGFKNKGNAAEMKFSADVGGGVLDKDAEIRWDFTGDDQPDQSGKDVTWTYPQPGKYKVTLWVKDKVYGRVQKVTREVTVENRGAAEVRP
jgi:hypothetical protein